MSHPFPEGGAPTQQHTYLGGVATVALFITMAVYLTWYSMQTWVFTPNIIVYREEPNNFKVGSCHGFLRRPPFMLPG